MSFQSTSIMLLACVMNIFMRYKLNPQLLPWPEKLTHFSETSM